MVGLVPANRSGPFGTVRRERGADDVDSGCLPTGSWRVDVDLKDNLPGPRVGRDGQWAAWSPALHPRHDSACDHESRRRGLRLVPTAKVAPIFRQPRAGILA